MVEFAGSSDAHHDSKLLLDHLKSKFPNAKLSIARVLDYDLMRGATIQMGATKDDLHGKILETINHSSLVTGVYPIHVLTQKQRKASTTSTYSLADNDSPQPRKIRRVRRAPIKTTVPKDLEKMRQVLPHYLTQVDTLHQQGNTGQGIHIAIISDGVDYNHPALGGGFGPGFKVFDGWDFVGAPSLDVDIWNGIISFPDNDPLDECSEYFQNGYGGYGTQVAGVIGGYLNTETEYFQGAAPGANLSSWRVMGCDGLTYEDIVIDAMNRAYVSGAQIIVVDVYFDGAWSERPVAVAAEKIVNEGRIVIAGAGLNGDNTIFGVTSPSSGKGVVSVASVDNQYNIEALSTSVSVEGLSHTIGILSPKNVHFPSGELVIPGSDACQPHLIDSNIKGKIAIIPFSSSCPYTEQVYNLKEEGVIGIIVANQEKSEGPFNPSIEQFVNIPVAGITYADGTNIVNAFNGLTSVPIITHFTIESNIIDTFNSVSEFSSHGPSYEFDFKPNIAGIGGHVYTTAVPHHNGLWRTGSSTSLAAAYVAGCFALYLKALEDKIGYVQPELLRQQSLPEFVLEQFQNYANIGRPSDPYYTPFHQGAGLVQVNDAILQTTHISPGAISFNDTVHGIRKHSVTISNYGTSVAHYKIVNSNSHVVFEISNYDFDNGITIHPHKSKTIDIELEKHEENYNSGMFSGFITFISNKKLQPSSKDINVPYIGMFGNARNVYYDITRKGLFLSNDPENMNTNMFTEGYPILFNHRGDKVQQDNTLLYNRKAYNSSKVLPMIEISLSVPTIRVEYLLYNSNNNQMIGHALQPKSYLQISTKRKNETFSNYWDVRYYVSDPPTKEQRVSSLQLPRRVDLDAGGPYHFIIRALRLYGDPNNIDDWDVWLSNTFRIV
ncbi:peptidase S8/S53 domain-containing protein [Phascolomyces articulosus]|uniref:Peptidase S8/S53 domain-containing protein n=1 Tax=Phascolomyces articulosus TaxID=60185 RepID=A0AAD5P8D7_9FUNG|nr:peptidase S8/S53 domain-containing protein [Phascolomyces articulosus]